MVARPHKEAQLCQALDPSLCCPGLLYPSLTTTSESESELESEGAEAALPENQETVQGFLLPARNQNTDLAPRPNKQTHQPTAARQQQARQSYKEPSVPTTIKQAAPPLHSSGPSLRQITTTGKTSRTGQTALYPTPTGYRALWLLPRQQRRTRRR